MKQLNLFGLSIFPDDSPVLMDYKPGNDWQDYFKVMAGEWHEENGWLIGTEYGNKGGILFTKESFDDDVMLSCTMASVLPAERDLNAVFCAHWDESTDYLGESYVTGINGWYEHKSGIERNGSEISLHASTTLYKYVPGKEIRLSAGAVNGHCFLTVDDLLVTELIDPNPIRGGHVGFSPYCTRLKIKDIQVRKIVSAPLDQEYSPEFN